MHCMCRYGDLSLYIEVPFDSTPVVQSLHISYLQNQSNILTSPDSQTSHFKKS